MSDHLVLHPGRHSALVLQSSVLVIQHMPRERLRGLAGTVAFLDGRLGDEQETVAGWLPIDVVLLLCVLCDSIDCKGAVQAFQLISRQPVVYFVVLSVGVSLPQ